MASSFLEEFWVVTAEGMLEREEHGQHTSSNFGSLKLTSGR